MVCQVVIINMTSDVKQRLSLNIIYLFHNILISVNFRNIKYKFLFCTDAENCAKWLQCLHTRQAVRCTVLSPEHLAS